MHVAENDFLDLAGRSSRRQLNLLILSNGGQQV